MIILNVNNENCHNSNNFNRQNEGDYHFNRRLATSRATLNTLDFKGKWVMNFKCPRMW